MSNTGRISKNILLINQAGSSGGGGSTPTPTLTVATFGDLPAGVLYQQIIVDDNGFADPAFVVFDGSQWLVTQTVVLLTASLPADGVWNLSPVVNSTTSTIAYSSESASYWNWDSAVWVEYEIAVAPTVTVSTFSLLPSDAIVGMRVAVTGETGLSGVVCINTAENTWELETASCAYSVYSAIEWGSTPGEWYNAGGIVVTTAFGCKLTDTTNQSIFVWDTANLVFVPAEVMSGTITSVAKIKGDSATPTDWFISNSAGTGTSTTTTAGEKLILDTTNTGATPALASIVYQDIGLSSSTNAYIKCMVQLAGGGAAYAALFALADGSRSYNVSNSNLATGRWTDNTVGNPLTDQTAGDQDLVTTEVFFEMQKVESFCQFRINGGRWSVISGVSCTADANTEIKLLAYCVGAGSVSSNTVRHLAYMRY